MSGNEQFERDFESFLKEDDSRLAALYRKLPRPEPDAKLDAAVLAMARRAAAAAPQMRARAPRWIPALSAAAVVALAAGIAFRIGPQVWQERDSGALQKAINENAVAPRAAPTPPAVMAADTDALKGKGAQSAVPKPATVPEPPRQAAEPAPPAFPATAAPGAAGYAAPAKQEAHAQMRKVEGAAKRADAPVPRAFPQQAEWREQEKKSAEPGAATTATEAVDAQAAGVAVPEDALDRKRDEGSPPHAEAPPTPMSIPAAAAPPPPAREESAPAPAATESSPALETQTATGGAPAESMLAAPAPAAAKAARMSPRSKDPNASLYPEHWLENIRIMLRERKRDEAVRSLAEFRKLYPDYHLPDDLRDLK